MRQFFSSEKTGDLGQTVRAETDRRMGPIKRSGGEAERRVAAERRATPVGAESMVESVTAPKSPEQAIKEGGGTFKGIQEGIPGKVKGLALFDHPETGSTLALPEDAVTSEAVRDKLTAHKAEWDAKRPAVGPAEEKLNKLAEEPIVRPGVKMKDQTLEPVKAPEGPKLSSRPDKAVHQTAGANEAEQDALHSITNAELGELASRAGYDMGTRTVGRAKGKSVAEQVSRADVFSALYKLGLKPSDILEKSGKFSKNAIEMLRKP